MIVKIYSRIFTEDLDKSLQVLQPMIDAEPGFRVKFQDMEVAVLGDFCFLAGPHASLTPFLGAVGPVIVDDLTETQAALERDGAVITQPITEGPTGWNIFSKSPDGVVIEWVQWRPDVWDRVNASSSNDLSLRASSGAASPARSPAAPLPNGFSEATAQVNGVSIHYVIGGTGDPLVLVHGWPQTWFCWQRIMPQLAEHFTVIALDLRGAGGSSKPDPSAGYDSRTMAEDVHQLVEHLGFGSIRIAGHDIGLLVAFAYAAAYPDRVDRLVILDGVLVGIEPMTSTFQQDPRSWVFGLAQTPELPEKITAGRERTYLTWFYTNIAFNRCAITEAEIDVYVSAYSAPGAMSAGFEWFRAFDEDKEFNRASIKKKLRMPVLALGGEKMMGPIIVTMMQTVAEDVRGGSIPECGHWVIEEKPEYLLAQLLAFLP